MRLLLMRDKLYSLSCLFELVAALQLKLVARISLLQVPFQLNSIVELALLQVVDHCFPSRLSDSFRI